MHKHTCRQCHAAQLHVELAKLVLQLAMPGTARTKMVAKEISLTARARWQPAVSVQTRGFLRVLRTTGRQSMQGSGPSICSSWCSRVPYCCESCQLHSVLHDRLQAPKDYALSNDIISSRCSFVFHTQESLAVPRSRDSTDLLSEYLRRHSRIGIADTHKEDRLQVIKLKALRRTPAGLTKALCP